MKIYSKQCEYAIRALAHVRYDGPAEPFSLKDACRRARISESFTRKTFQALVRKRILSAKHGPGGGYRFRVPPETVTVLDVIRAIDGKAVLETCALRRRGCGDGAPCEIHEAWKAAKGTFVSELSSRTIRSLMAKESNKEERA